MWNKFQHSTSITKTCKQAQCNTEMKTSANEYAVKRNTKACSTEQNVKTKTKVSKSKHIRRDKLQI